MPGAEELDAPSRGLVRTAVDGARLVWQVAPRATSLVVVFTVVTSLVGPLTIWLTKVVVDAVAKPHTTSMLVPGLLAVGLVSASNRVLMLINQSIQMGFQDLLEQRATVRLLRHAAVVDMATLEDPTALDELDRAAQGAGYRPANLMYALVGLLASCVTLLAVCGVLLALDPRLVLVVVISALPIFFVQRVTNRWVYTVAFDMSQTVREKYYYRNLVLLRGAADANREIRAADLGRRFADRYDELATERRNRDLKVYVRASAYSAAAGLVAGLITAAGYVMVALNAGSGFTPGSMAAVIAAITAVASSAGGLTAYLANIDQQALFLQDYFGFLERMPSLVSPEAPIALPSPIKGVVFDNITFRYRPELEPVLRDVSFTIAPGSMVALVGDNGAGKSTLVKALLRLYDVDRGSIRIGGVDVRDAAVEEVRARIGVLFQDFVNYQLTVREAVSLGRPDASISDDRIWSALERAQAAQFVRRFDKGLDARLGRVFEGGNELSGGQWQRIALARLIYRDADIWVLDEPTSALDPEAEAAIFADLREQLRDRIGIVISHRFSTVRIADAIAVLDDGRLIEYGTHDELVARGGRYAQLFELQAAGYR